MTNTTVPTHTLVDTPAGALVSELVRRLMHGLRRRAAAWAIPAAIILLAAPLRFIGLDWDSSQHLHPDERFITMVSTGIELPRNLSEYFDTARSPLNPYNRNFGSYVYGTLPLFFVRGLAEAIQTAARAIPGESVEVVRDLWPHLRDAAGYGNINLLGRVLSGLADLAALVLVYLSGRRIGGRTLGILAAAIGSFSVLQIQAAHFLTAEGPLVLFTTLAFYFALRVVQTNAWSDWIFLGVSCALALTTKLTAGLLVVLVASAVWLLWRSSRAAEGGERITGAELITGVLAAAASGMLTFRLAQPYAFAGPGFLDILPNPKYLADLATWQQIASGQSDYPPSHQWTGATPFLWQIENMTRWGMGPAFALTAAAGFVLAGIGFLRDPARYRLQLLGLLWVGVNFLYWGPQFAKPMRYLLPIYPQLAILAAFALLAFWGWARQRGALSTRPRLWQSVGIALPVVVVGWTACYAVAFASIYTRPTTRVGASLWMYEHIPPGSRIAWEHWDDPLPLNLPGHPSSVFTGVELPLYGEDIPEKREQLSSKLDEANYIVLSSNRLYGSIPKLPLRYPMTVRYYEALFNGELGFAPVAEFTSRPGLLGIELNDDNAEEIFTVYEHPKVSIFAKTAGYSPENTRRILGAVSLDSVLRGLKPIHLRSGGLLLTPGEREADRAGGTWAAWFNRDSLANRLPILAWLGAVELLGLLAFPVVAYLLRGLADRGYALAKVVGLLVLAYIPWVLASLHLLPYDLPALGIGAVALLSMSAFVGWRTRLELWDFVRRQRWVILASEALFLTVFGVFLAVRAANPDLWHPAYGGEKPMDFAFLNAVIRSTWFPPYDPWLAGGYINYYYFGFVIIGSLIKVTGVVPWVAYNLALPLLAALVATAVASLVYNLLVRRPDAPAGRRAWAAGGGVVGAILAVFSGNLQGAVQIIDWLNRVGGEPVQSLLPAVGGAVSALRGLALIPLAWARGQPLPPFQFDFWAPTRVISTEPVTPITEFPFFTFLYGDLHAHMIAMPIALATLAIALNLVRQPLTIPGVAGSNRRRAARELFALLKSPSALSVLAAGALIGVLRMTNTWDFPTYFGVLAVALAIGQRRSGDPRSRSWLTIGILIVAVGVVSQITAAPFLARYTQFYSGIELNRAHTSLPHYLTVVGAFLLVLGCSLAVRLNAARQLLGSAATSVLGVWSGASTLRATAASLPYVATWTTLGFPILGAIALGLALILLVGGLPVVAIALMFITLGTPFALRANTASGPRFVLLLAGTALALTAGVELLVLKGDIGRMNTVFKFYLQAWLFLSVASAVLLTLLARRACSLGRRLRGGGRAAVLGLALVLGAGLIYPVLGAPARLQHRFTQIGPGLDGMAYMQQARYEDNNRDLVLRDDYHGINWLLDHVEGSPTILEGTAPLYHWGSRVSTNTGLPTVVGWDWHQKQQRGDFAYMVDDRIRDVGLIFNTSSEETALSLLRRYGVEYVYVGGLERAFYGADGLSKFDQMTDRGLSRVYQQGVVSIYRVQA